MIKLIFVCHPWLQSSLELPVSDTAGPFMVQVFKKETKNQIKAKKWDPGVVHS